MTLAEMYTARGGISQFYAAARSCCCFLCLLSYVNSKTHPRIVVIAKEVFCKNNPFDYSFNVDFFEIALYFNCTEMLHCVDRKCSILISHAESDYGI